MHALLMTTMFAAAGYSLIYLLFGGGLGKCVHFRHRKNVRQMSVVNDSTIPTAPWPMSTT